MTVAGLRPQPGNRSTEVCLSRIPERLDQRMILQNALHHCTLDPDASAVNQPYFAQAGLGGCANILLDDRWDVARRERVEVERPFDGNVVSHF